jgi:nicotinate-nucleotide pyrophosphorylase (carboxylating)
MSDNAERSARGDDEWLYPPHAAVADVVARALAEDLTPLGDLTAALLPEVEARAHLATRAAGRLAGTRCADAAFAAVDPSIDVSWSTDEGADLTPGEIVAVVTGPLRSIVTAERTALNLLGHLSGIATLTARFVAAAAEAGGTARIWDTRKTTPGLRSLEKAAVRAGGGRNHRGNLSDWLLIKDNHLGALSVTAAVVRARDLWPGRTVHVECDTVEQCVEAIEGGADAVLLDNMSADEVRMCVAEASSRQGGLARRTLLEVSGGVTLATVGELAATGVDMISVGAITNSAPVLDMGLDLV